MCQGVITRIRELENKTERAILDFFVMNDKNESVFIEDDN